MADKKDEKRSAFAAAVEEAHAERECHVFDDAERFYHGLKGKHRLGVRVIRRWDTDTSLAAAHSYVADRTHGLPGADNARRDGDLLGDSKSIEVIFRATRDPDDQKYPAFPSTSWMRKHFSTQEIGALLNLVNEVVKRETPMRTAISYEVVQDLAKRCADYADTDVPEALLATCDREWLSEAFVLLSVLYGRATESLQGAIDEADGSQSVDAAETPPASPEKPGEGI